MSLICSQWLPPMKLPTPTLTSSSPKAHQPLTRLSASQTFLACLQGVLDFSSHLLLNKEWHCQTRKGGNSLETSFGGRAHKVDQWRSFFGDSESSVRALTPAKQAHRNPALAGTQQSLSAANCLHLKFIFLIVKALQLL